MNTASIGALQAWLIRREWENDLIRKVLAEMSAIIQEAQSDHVKLVEANDRLTELTLAGAKRKARTRRGGNP